MVAKEKRGYRAHRWGALLFGVGVLIGLALSACAIWGDLEASLFDPSLRGDAPLHTLRCPVIVGKAESGLVRVTFANPLDRPVELTIRTHISRRHITLMDEIDSRLPLAPRETKTLEWPIKADGAVYGHLVFVNVRLFGQHPLVSRSGSCGILILALPYVRGNLIIYSALVLSLAGMLSGVWLGSGAYSPLNERGADVSHAMWTLLLCVLAGMMMSLLGWWLPGVLALAVVILVLGVTAGRFAAFFARP